MCCKTRTWSKKELKKQTGFVSVTPFRWNTVIWSESVSTVTKVKIQTKFLHPSSSLRLFCYHNYCYPLRWSSCWRVKKTNLRPDDKRKRKQQQWRKNNQGDAAKVPQSSAQSLQHSVFLLSSPLQVPGCNSPVVRLKDSTAADKWLAGTRRQVDPLLRDSGLKLFEVAGYVSISVGVFLSKTPNLLTNCWLSRQQHKGEIILWHSR